MLLIWSINTPICEQHHVQSAPVKTSQMNESISKCIEYQSDSNWVLKHYSSTGQCLIVCLTTAEAKNTGEN